MEKVELLEHLISRGGGLRLQHPIVFNFFTTMCVKYIAIVTGCEVDLSLYINISFVQFWDLTYLSSCSGGLFLLLAETPFSKI